jgi:hypothetical protein
VELAPELLALGEIVRLVPDATQRRAKVGHLPPEPGDEVRTRASEPVAETASVVTFL